MFMCQFTGGGQPKYVAPGIWMNILALRAKMFIQIPSSNFDLREPLAQPGRKPGDRNILAGHHYIADGATSIPAGRIIGVVGRQKILI